MKTFQNSDKLNKEIDDLLNDETDIMALADVCAGHIDEDTTAYEAAGIGFDVGQQAGSRPVYSYEKEDIVFFFIGNPDEILQAIKNS
jgi:hypothetical protein